MARNYVPASIFGAELFLTFFMEDDRLIADTLSDSVQEQGNPEPTCLMDVLYLWLRAGARMERRGDIGTAFYRCPTYDSYLQTVFVIIDLWQRMPEAFDWPGGVKKEYGLEPIVELFPALPTEDLLEQKDLSKMKPDAPRRYARGGLVLHLLRAQYDHPALRRDTYEFYKQEATRAQREWATSS
ncbi:hypothetical protein ACFC14_13600 [Microbacterium sp. NPDC055988]|uniref:hypothetical protein n=1 Tax=Microbacterium sp. NPDC055988 TaxID=3345671 RepID=UPI0035D6F8F9